jgi:hypothetical protein
VKVLNPDIKNYTMKKINISIIGIVMIFILKSLPASSQENASHKSNNIINLVNAKEFTFIAQSVMPSHGGYRTLTSDYELTVAGDSIISYLPYFGQAYSITDPNSNPLQFTSINNKISVTPSKKGNYNVTINFINGGDVRQLNLSVTSSGNSTLNAIFNNRQPISFNGYITKRKLLHK